MAEHDRFPRLRAVQETWQRYKVTTIRVVLGLITIVVILAQFVPPIGDFLSRGRYLGTGLIVGMALIIFDAIVSPGLSTTASVDRSLALKSYNELGEYLGRAFQLGAVDLDIAAYSTETFHRLLSPLFRDVLEGRIRLHHLSVRILIPDYALPMSLPSSVVTQREDPEYKQMIRNRSANYVALIEDDLERMSQNGIINDVRIEVRKHALLPLFKCAIVNNSTAFFGLYPIDRTPGSSRQSQMWDFKGERAPMIGAPSQGNNLEVTLYQSLRGWFDSVWRNLSKPYHD
jgi:hypothetical protein